jgi:hypothetical protein
MILPLTYVQVFQERIVEDVDDERVMTRHCRVVDADVIVREAPDRIALLAHVVLGEHLPIEMQYQPGHE